MENGSILRFFKVSKKIDLLVLDQGKYPQQRGELVLDKCYAMIYGLSTGDTINIHSGSYRITARQEYVYSYKLANGCTEDDLRKEILTSNAITDDVLSFVPRNNNARMCRAIIDGYAYELGGYVLGIGLIVLVSVVFYLGIRTTIERESASIGALYSMGVKKYEVIFMYLAPSTLVVLFSGLLGFQLSKLAVPYLLGTTAVGVFLYLPVTAFIRDFLVIILIYVLSTSISLSQMKKIYELDYVRENE